MVLEPNQATIHQVKDVGVGGKETQLALVMPFFWAMGWVSRCILSSSYIFMAGAVNKVFNFKRWQ